jgi:hypothetical protein
MPEERKSPIEKLGDAIVDCLPESWQTEKVAYGLGCVVGFLAGWFVGETVVNWIFSNKGDKR